MLKILRKYIRGVGLAAQEDAAGTRQYALYNAHGDVVQLTNTSGAVSKTYDYDAFGNERQPDPNDTNPFRYCGEYLDQETNTYYLRARNYDPTIGRFLTEDTHHGDPQNSLSLNLYTYCWNSPILHVDATGNWPTLKDTTRTIVRGLVANPAAVYATKNGWFSDLFYAAGFVRDSGTGIYHSRPDAWQQIGGFNDFYDVIFDHATSMKKAKFKFTSADREYMFWAWKGNYLNLGAGAELGIYSNKSGILGKVNVTSPLDSHWLVDTSLAMKMSMTLHDDMGNHILSYSPREKQWWITGFSPYEQKLKAHNLTARYTVTFNNKTMYNDFLKSDDYLNNTNKWSIIDADKYKMQLKFQKAS